MKTAQPPTCTSFHRALVLMGSNIAADYHIRRATALLSVCFGACTRFSTPLWTEAVNVVSYPYLNRLALLHTPLSAEELAARLKALERVLGRRLEDKAAGRVCIDLDLLQHGVVRYHEHDWNFPFMPALLASLPFEEKAE